jgi:hypothetical protein
MLDEMKADPTIETTLMKLRFLDLPPALEPLVKIHGLPDVEISREMSVLTWMVPRSADDSSVRSGSSRGLILARVESEEHLGDGVRDIQALERTLAAIGRPAEAIVSSCGGSQLNDFDRPDLRWARERMTRRALSWIAVNHFEASSEQLGDVGTVFLPEFEGCPVRESAEGLVLTLCGGEMFATDAVELSYGPPRWESLRLRMGPEAIPR